MIKLLHIILILVMVLLIEDIRCQVDDSDMMGYQQMTSDDGQIETMTSYSTNIIQRDPNSHSLSSVNVQYHITDDDNKNVNYNRADHGRSKKIYRIKNPFHRPLENIEKNEGNNDLHNTGTAASNQYAAMKYSLPPEEFLQKLRAENQYYQQVSTPSPMSYTDTPQLQYQLSSISTPNYDSNQQSNQFQHDPKISQTQTYLSNSNYPYATNNFRLDVVQSTPSPINSYLSTPSPNHYLSTPANPYISSSSPIFLSSPPNLQSYVSSPLTSVQASSPDYNHRMTSTIGSNSLNFDNNEVNKNLQLDHYGNSVNSIRYPVSMQQQYQNNYPTSTSMPLSPSYTYKVQDNFQNTLNSGVNALPKSIQEVSLSQLQNIQYKQNQQETAMNSETHRMGNLPSANNIYLNYVQPDYQALTNLKSRLRDSQQDSNQQDLPYSNGEYGWKLNDNKQLSSVSSYTNGNFPKYSGVTSESDGGAVSQMNFHMDTGKNYNTESNTRSSSQNTLAQEFAKAAAKANEDLKQQQQLFGNNYPSNLILNNQQTLSANTFYGGKEKKKNKYADESNQNVYGFSSSPAELITVSPYNFGNARDINFDNKPKLSFDHAKALQNIVSIDVSNVVPNSQTKLITGVENDNKYNTEKNQLDQNINQYYRTLADSYYKDKNSHYGFHIKTKPEDFFSSDYLRPTDLNTPYTGKQYQSLENSHDSNTFSGTPQSLNFKPQGVSIYEDNIQSPANFQQQELPISQNHLPSDIASILKLNDVPQQLTQGLSSDSLRLHNNNFDQTGVPSSLPVKINQNLGSHQLDVTANILSKLLNKHQGSLNRPDLETISTINGFKVANPFNVDLRLVAEMLKGKPTIDETHVLALKDQFSKPAPLKIDLSQLQAFLRNENSLAPLTDNMSAYSNPYIDVYGSGSFHNQGVKYSRSQEEEESIIPIAETTNTHPIGAVFEQVDTDNDITTGSDITSPVDENDVTNFEDDRNKKSQISSQSSIGDRHRRPLKSLLKGRHTYEKKYPVGEPYRLLKPPPLQSTRHRGNYSRRRRMNKPKVFRILKSETLYDDEPDAEHAEPTISIVLRPPSPNAKEKSDTVQTS